MSHSVGSTGFCPTAVGICLPFLRFAAHGIHRSYRSDGWSKEGPRGDGLAAIGIPLPTCLDQTAEVKGKGKGKGEGKGKGKGDR